MKIREFFRISTYLMFIFSIAGCNLPILISPAATLDRDQISTAAAQTIEVTFTLGALSENLNKPTLTLSFPSANGAIRDRCGHYPHIYKFAITNPDQHTPVSDDPFHHEYELQDRAEFRF